MDLHVDHFSMALHNSLKDIAPHEWMDPVQILERRGVDLSEFKAQVALAEPEVESQRELQATRAQTLAQMRAHENNLSPEEVRKRQVAPADEAMVIDPNMIDPSKLSTRPPNIETFGTEMGRQNVQVSKVIKDFFEKHKCKPWGACSPYR